MGTLDFKPGDAKAQQTAVAIFGRVLDPELRQATDLANWAGTGATWGRWPEKANLQVVYHARFPNPRDRQFHMEGEVRAENSGEGLAVSLNCHAEGGRMRDPDRKEVVEIRNVKVTGTQSWPVADASESAVRQWVREKLMAFIDECKKAQAVPH